MFLVGLITWWYGRGWREQVLLARRRLAATAAFFSIDQLFKTLFAPFRQISAGKVSGPVGVMLRGLFDNLVSRIIGAIVRLFTILGGAITLVFQSIYEVTVIIFWLLLPLFPIIGLIMFAIGWMPRWM